MSMSLRRLAVATTILSVLVPVSAFALEGVGPRVTISGTVQTVTITDKQAFDQVGGEVTVLATNGQVVTIVITKDTQIISEGRLSRKYLLPVNITVGMQVRVRGWRIDSKSLTASLFIIQNIEVNPVLSGNGTIQSFDGTTLTVLSPDGQSHAYIVTNETEVNMNYTLYGSSALTLVGKKALLTLNPSEPKMIRILRINGDADATRTVKPTTVDLKKR